MMRILVIFLSLFLLTSCGGKGLQKTDQKKLFTSNEQVIFDVEKQLFKYEFSINNYSKKTITNFVIHLQKDKIIKSFDDYDMRTMVLAETDDKQKDFTEVVDEINSLIKKQSKKKAR